MQLEFAEATDQSLISLSAWARLHLLLNLINLYSNFNDTIFHTGQIVIGQCGKYRIVKRLQKAI